MKVVYSTIFALALLLLYSTVYSQREKTAFQVSDPWKPDYDIRSDVAIVYGIHDGGGDFAGRVKLWKEKGYAVHFMTGIAWGQYQDYFMGKYDGKTHWDEGQVQRNGDTIWHGKYVPYIVPTENFIGYMKSIVKQAIDAGVTAVHLEEPEFWSRSGYSDAFKKEWQKYYGFAWMPQHESPEATYLSSKLKYQLYYNALKEVFHYVKSYSKSIGRDVKCYVPTHSLLNYSSWHIVSPEASLAQLPDMDGYIAQIWTGTSREPVFYNGVAKERVFENAFLEYGSMVSMTAPTKRKVFFLTDPIEDRAQTWDDYKRNYQATYTAQLLYPMVADYEVMPWPPRIYLGKFKMENSDTRVPISPEYATQMQVMVNALNDMPLSKNTISGSKGIAVLLCNSMMFQRFPTHEGYEDPYLSNFYGMVMPLLKKGIPVETVHMENLNVPASLKNIKILVMSYANMKPMSPEVHRYLAQWVKNGGTLLYYGKDTDPFQTVKEWWNSNGNHYSSPSEHLFELLGIEVNKEQQQYNVGKGRMYVIRKDPKELVTQAGQDADFLEKISQTYKAATNKELQVKNNFYLQRGAYDIAAVMGESVTNEPLHINGPVIDMFDPSLPILKEKTINPGEQSLLYNLTRTNKSAAPKVLCTAARVYNEKKNSKAYAFMVKSPSNTMNVMRILLKKKPAKILVTDQTGQAVTEFKSQWDTYSSTLLLQFPNSSNGINVSIQW